MSTVYRDQVRATAPGRPPRPRRRLQTWAAVAVVVVTGAVLTWIVAFSSVLAVRTVRIVGTDRLDTGTVRSVADVTVGRPLIRVPRGAVERRIEALPEVRSARVTLSFPSTVVITVTERVAAGYRQLTSTSWTLVDATGSSFGTLATAPADLPLLAPAAAVSADPATLAALAGVAGAVPARIRAHLSELTANDATSVQLNLRDGRTVLWGSVERNADKARLLPALLKRPGTVFDISNPELVSAR